MWSEGNEEEDVVQHIENKTRTRNSFVREIVFVARGLVPVTTCPQNPHIVETCDRGRNEVACIPTLSVGSRPADGRQ